MSAGGGREPAPGSCSPRRSARSCSSEGRCSNCSTLRSSRCTLRSHASGPTCSRRTSTRLWRPAAPSPPPSPAASARSCSTSGSPAGSATCSAARSCGRCASTRSRRRRRSLSRALEEVYAEAARQMRHAVDLGHEPRKRVYGPKRCERCGGPIARRAHGDEAASRTGARRARPCSAMVASNANGSQAGADIGVGVAEQIRAPKGQAP